eukprot:TRINITY_DN4067_c0_g1_i1.p1 TRINITY_DN4067_c0_g1~~TRINITY_DN4067_c0_g1_i1.p1  ORF type:complete len:156 (-),score=32.30 TRINITY_DN4067_c0_g1_i1:554-1021(-)
MTSALKIYFCGSMRGGRQDVDLYGKLVEKLGAYGSVLTPFVADKKITNLGSEHAGGDKGIHDRDVELLEQSDVIVAEVTQPSLGVGYEIGRAVAMNKPILCLYRPQEGKLLSGMIRGMDNGSDLRALDYSIDQVDGIIKNFMAQGFVKTKDGSSQ